MRLLPASLIGLTLLAGLSGCQCGNRVRLERELRAREEDVRELREELDRSEAYNHHIFQELRGPHCDGAGPAPPGTEHVVGLSPVQSLVLGRQTGGHNDGSCAGDDGVQVQAEPRDPEGHAVKIAGSLNVQLLEINREGLKRPISSWELGPEQLRRHWRQGLLSSGYVVTLPWKVWPTTEKLRVVANFRPIDGRVFEAEKDITVRLPPLEQRRPLPPPEMPAGPADVLPPPRPVEQPGPIIEMKSPSDKPITTWRAAAVPPAAEIQRPVAGP